MIEFLPFLYWAILRTLVLKYTVALFAFFFGAGSRLQAQVLSCFTRLSLPLGRQASSGRSGGLLFLFRQERAAARSYIGMLRTGKSAGPRCPDCHLSHSCRFSGRHRNILATIT